MFLKTARIQRYRSLYDTTFQFGNLTIIVGPNSSGKSNLLNSLNFLNQLITIGKPPPNEYIIERQHFASPEPIHIEVEFTDPGHPELKDVLRYQLEVARGQRNAKFLVERLEELSEGSNPRMLIDINKEDGFVLDGSDEQRYRSPELALASAGKYGDRATILRLQDDIAGWKFFNLNPELMRSGGIMPVFTAQSMVFLDDENDLADEDLPQLDARGTRILRYLRVMARTNVEFFNDLNRDLEQNLGFSLSISSAPPKRSRKHSAAKAKIAPGQVIIKEGEREHPLALVSDGTWRLIAYFILLNSPTVPPLIGIEEPESNLHPAMLRLVAKVLERLAQRTQVIVSTHSSQLLDCFKREDLGPDLSILLLQRSQGKTQCTQLADLSEHEALQDWMRDFGIGSALFHSNLIPPLDA